MFPLFFFGVAPTTFSPVYMMRFPPFSAMPANYLSLARRPEVSPESLPGAEGEKRHSAFPRTRSKDATSSSWPYY